MPRHYAGGQQVSKGPTVTDRPGLSPKECVFNRGIFVMDVAQWKRLHITQDIEHWMGKYRESKKDQQFDKPAVGLRLSACG